MSIKHGLAKSRLDNIYGHMIRRCYSSKCKAYSNYGGRGITVCDEWRNDKTAFFKWSLDNGYSDKLTIDRIDNSKGYSPENCRWASQKLQQNNRTNNHLLEIAGETHTVSEWSEISHVAEDTILARLKLGWTPIDAVFTVTQSGKINLISNEILNYLSAENPAEWRKVMEYATRKGFSVNSFRTALNKLIKDGIVERQRKHKGYHKGTETIIALIGDNTHE